MSEENLSLKTQLTRDLIDPLYAEFTRELLDTVSGTQFYEYFMDALEHAKTELQFSNRRLDKMVDDNWIDEIEDVMPSLTRVVNTPRVSVVERYDIVNVSAAKRCDSSTVRHLAQNSQLVQDYDEQRGEVRPARLQQKFLEEEMTMYEARLAYTVLEQLLHFVRIRYELLLAALDDEQGARLNIKTRLDGPQERFDFELRLHLQQKDDFLETDARHSSELDRIARLYRLLQGMMGSQFAQEMRDHPRVKGNLVRTNVLRKHKDYKKIADLYDKLRSYNDTGYYVRIRDQDPEITDEFKRNIFHAVLLQYMTLKSYLADAEERVLPTIVPEREATVTPQFVRQVVEERVDEITHPEVEVRKVLVEELTKADLMKEEAAERRRLVEEQTQRRREEAARQKAEREAERARQKAEREAERERLRIEEEKRQKEEEQNRLYAEQLAKRRVKAFREELLSFQQGLEQQLYLRTQVNEHLHSVPAPDDYSNAVLLMEAEEERHRQEAERERLRAQQERERLERERREAEEAARRAEEARLEQERLAAEAAALEAERQRMQSAREQLSVFLPELKTFYDTRAHRAQLRREELSRWASRMGVEWEHPAALHFDEEEPCTDETTAETPVNRDGGER